MGPFCLLDDLRAHREIQLARGGEIGAHQVQVVQLHAAVIVLRVQKIQQRCSAMLIRKRNRFANPGGLVEVFGLVGPQQDPAAIQGGEGGIGVAEHLRFGRFLEPFVAPDVELCARLLPLVAVEMRNGIFTLTPK